MKTFYLLQLDCPNYPLCVGNSPCDSGRCPDLIDAPIGFLLLIGVVLTMIILFKK